MLMQCFLDKKFPDIKFPCIGSSRVEIFSALEGYSEFWTNFPFIMFERLYNCYSLLDG
jgi:hypothetical protein